MTGPRVVGGQNIVYPSREIVGDDHAALIAWQRELDAERAPIPTCTCFTVDAEFLPGCVIHPEENAEAS